MQRPHCSAPIVYLTLVAGLVGWGLLRPAQASDWTGTVNQDWFDSNNWTGGVPAPGSANTILIPSPFPVVLGGIVDVASVQIGDFVLGASRLDIVGATFNSIITDVQDGILNISNGTGYTGNSLWARSGTQINISDSTLVLSSALDASNLSILNSVVSAQRLFVGYDDESVSTSFEVSGSQLTIAQELQILGSNSMGRFDAGSVVVSGIGLVGALIDEGEAGYPINAVLTVDGPGTSWTVQTDLGVGAAIVEELEIGDGYPTYGELIISNAATVASQRSIIGALVGLPEESIFVEEAEAGGRNFEGVVTVTVPDQVLLQARSCWLEPSAQRLPQRSSGKK